MRAKLLLSCTVLVALATVSTVSAADWGLKKGNADLKSAGPLAFGPDGILLIGDTKAATVFAIDTGDASGEPGKVSYSIKGLNEKVAEVVGQSVTINDVIVNPASGNVYVSASADGKAAIVRIDASGALFGRGGNLEDIDEETLESVLDGFKVVDENGECLLPREFDLELSLLTAGSCGDPSGCLDVGEFDFEDFCVGS